MAKQIKSWGFTDKADALTLKEVASERRREPKYGTGVSSPEKTQPVAGSVIVHLEEDLPAATVSDGVVTLGEATGFIYHRDNRLDSESSQRAEYEPASVELIPARNDSNSCLRTRVFNSTQELFSGCSYIECVLDRYGDLYVSSEVLETTLTTTTAIPVPEVEGCVGECKFLWTDSSGWVLDINGCNTTTTSTSTSTTTTSDPSATTTSTTPACVCGDPIPSSTTSTTEAPQCECAEPTFCGTADGDCTYTYCVDTNYQQPEPPECITTSTTTTTTSEPTTTTTCDCNTTTTTTQEPTDGCIEGCDWLSVPIRGWVLYYNGCNSLCSCLPPEDAPDICTTAHTDCVIPPPGTSTTQPPCTGNCIWWYNTVLE
jgi:hypothetical protein